MAAVHGVMLVLVGVMPWVDCTYQELTHVMDMDNICFHPSFADEYYHFKYRIDHAGPSGSNDFVAYNSLSMVEHMGTHYDAPYHYHEFGRQTHEIPLDDLHGPLVRIDIRDKAEVDGRATVDVEDLQNWEAEHGAIPDRAYVLMFSGWSQYWGDQWAYVGTNTTEEPDKMMWPGWSVEAAAWLLENRNILGLGVDAISCDAAGGGGVHPLILQSDKMCVENLGNLDAVPAAGAEFFHLPLLVKGGTGGQVRTYAFWDAELELFSGAPGLGAATWVSLLVAVVAHFVL